MRCKLDVGIKLVWVCKLVIEITALGVGLGQGNPTASRGREGQGLLCYQPLLFLLFHTTYHCRGDCKKTNGTKNDCDTPTSIVTLVVLMVQAWGVAALLLVEPICGQPHQEVGLRGAGAGRHEAAQE